ncbi:MAG: DUF47 family protein [Clostridia bacterium]|nr:DUF47 family protein [Clostridia bacterium]
MFNFKPKDDSFYDMLEEGSRFILKGAHLLTEIMDNPGKGQELSDDLYLILKAMRELSGNITKKLDQSFITPMDREDIGLLNQRLELLVSKLHGVADRMYLYKAGEPTEVSRKLVTLQVEAIKQVEQAIGNLRHVQANKEQIMKTCRRIAELESEADKVYRRGVAQLFSDEKDPIKLLKWKEIYEYLEESLNHCLYLANIIESVVLKYA